MRNSWKLQDGSALRWRPKLACWTVFLTSTVKGGVHSRLTSPRSSVRFLHDLWNAFAYRRAGHGARGRGPKGSKGSKRVHVSNAPTDNAVHSITSSQELVIGC